MKKSGECEKYQKNIFHCRFCLIISAALRTSISLSAITAFGFVISSNLPQVQAGLSFEMDGRAHSWASGILHHNEPPRMLKGVLGCARRLPVAQTGDTQFELPGTGSNPRSICGSVNNQSNIYAPPRVGVNDTDNQF